MDLTPLRFDRDADPAPLSAEMAVLLASVGARQAASVTARVQAGLAPSRGGQAGDPLFSPQDGAFNSGMARILGRGARGRKGQ